MAVPGVKYLFLPLLKLVARHGQMTMKEAIEELASEFDLSDEERRELLPVSNDYRWDTRVWWARVHLVKAGLLEVPLRGSVAITQSGKDHLSTNPAQLYQKDLLDFPKYAAWKKGPEDSGDSKPEDESEGNYETPIEIIESKITELKSELADELLQRLKVSSPAFFERLVVALLVRMGYGGSLKEAGQAVGRAGDGGIDGVINEDRLGLDRVYIQAKRWTEESVGRPEIQKFAGSLDMHHASKGVFITTSKFTSEAKEFVQLIQKRIVLIDGETLPYLMIDHNVGVSTEATYEVKRVDTDYFVDES